MTDSFRLFKKKSKKKSEAADTESGLQARSQLTDKPFAVTSQQEPPSVSAAPTVSTPARAASTTASPVEMNNSIMDEELSRMRDELSRTTTTCERREMEVARADADLHHCREELVRVTAIKTETDHENRKLQAEVASLERERARVVSETDRLKEDLGRTRTKLADKKRLVAELKAELKRGEEERESLERSAKDREQTWHTIRRDVSSKRDDAIRDACKMRRENEKLKSRVNKLKMEKSNILLRMWEKKQSEMPSSRRSSTHKVDSDRKEIQEVSCQPQNENHQAKVLSLELQLFRQARLVELLLDVIQSHDPQFTAQERSDLTSAFVDAGSIPDLLARKVRFV